ncbi:MAG: aromatic hydrocarbon degradation protein [Niabella sp.]
MVKRIFILGAGVFGCLWTIAQAPEDVLRYSWQPATGTARVQALGGASGAIGGEISTMFSNPANIGFYRTGDVVVSPGLQFNKNKNTYWGTKTNNDASNSFQLGTSGVVLGSDRYGGSVKSSAFGLGVSTIANFNNEVFYKGHNTHSSMADMFIDDFDGNYRNQFGNDLADRTYWVHYDDATKRWTSPAIDLLSQDGVGLNQQQRIKSEGGITELALAGGWNFNNRVYFGTTIGIPIVRYERTREYQEWDPTEDNNNNFDYAVFQDYLKTTGAGINLKLGVLFTPTDNFRLGLALHTPTFYDLQDKYYSSAEANVENYLGGNGKTWVASSYDADAKNYFRNNGVLQSDYQYRTPLKLMGSFTYLFGNPTNVNSQRGLITGDVEYVGQNMNRFKSSYDDNDDDRYYDDLNSSIKDYYKSTVNARLGVELKFNPIAVRLGGAYYSNPYKDVGDGAKGSMVQATGGVGYRNKGFFLDLGYVHALNKDVVFPYRTTYESFQPNFIKNNAGRVTLTFGIKI